MVMVGFGRNRAQDATTNATVSDAVALVGGGTGYTATGVRIKRWGTNTVENQAGPGNTVEVDMGGFLTTTFESTFTSPDSVPAEDWFTSNEGQGSRGDSGGAVFINEGGEWILAGMMSAVTDADEFGLSDSTYSTDIATYRSAIDTEIGVTLIPEPSSCLLLLSTTLLLLRRRR